MSTPRIPKAELKGVKGTVVKRMSRKLMGAVPEPVEVGWHNQQIVGLTFLLSRKAQKWRTCDAGLKSLAHLAVAGRIGCSFCLDLGFFLRENEGLDLVKAQQVARWRTSEAFTPLERDVLAYAEAMTDTPTAVTDELSARLLDALGAEALLELTAHVALSNFYARSNTALGVEAQGLSRTCALRPPAVAGVAA